MILRLATESDIPFMVRITNEAKAFLKHCDVFQWQVGDYPSQSVFRNDIQNHQSYVLCDDEKIVAFTAMILGDDPSYKTIDGRWLTKPVDPYAVIHRCAVTDSVRGQGVIGNLFEQCGNIAKILGAASLRIDTHADNRAMQKALNKSGFLYCGEIILAEGLEKGQPRLAYEKVLL